MEDSINKNIEGIRSDCFDLKQSFEQQLQTLFQRIDDVEQEYLGHQFDLRRQKEFQTVIPKETLTEKIEDDLVFEKKEVIIEKVEDDFIFENKEIVTEEREDDFVFEKKETIITEKVSVQSVIVENPLEEGKDKIEEVIVQKTNVKKTVVVKEKKPSILLTNSLTQTVLDVIFPPFKELSSFFSDTYQHYKSENKLPVFFMTLAGIVIMLFGFGFLAQYAVVNYADSLNNWVKLGMGMAVTSAVLLWAIRLSSKSQKFKEFGSALVGLTIIANYLFIYFLCESYLGFSVLEGFLLIVANTGIALWLALRYETRIVAILSLIGGACVPFYLPLSGGTELYFYFGFLFLLTISAVYTAHKISWSVLQNIAFFMSLGMIEYFVFSIEVFENQSIYAIIFHAFAYLFFFISLWDGKKIKSTLDKESVFMMAGNVGFFILNLYFLYGESNTQLLGTLYLINIIPTLVVLVTYYQKLERAIRLLLFVLIAAFVAVAIPALFESYLMGITWGVEACVLLYCGFIFNFSEVRKQAYLLLVFALVKIVSSIPLIFIHWNVNLFHEGYWNLVAFGLVILTVIAIYFANKKKVEDIKFDAVVVYFLLEVAAGWSLIILSTTSYYFLQEWTFALTIPFFLAVIYVANKPFYLKIAELWSIAGILLTVFLAYYFSLEALNYNYFDITYLRFSSQTMYAKVVLGEFLVLLWGLQWYYEKISPKNTWVYFAKALRILFYLLIPFIVLNISYKVAPDFIFYSLWLSVVASFVLHKIVKKTILLIFMYLWIIGVSIIIGGSLILLPEKIGFVPSMIGFLFLLGTYLYNKAYQIENSTGVYRLMHAYLYHYIAISTFIVGKHFEIEEVILISIITLYYFVLTLLKEKIYVLQKSIGLLHRFAFVGLTMNFFLLFNSSRLSDGAQVMFGFMTLLNLVLIAYTVYQKQKIYSENEKAWKLDLYWFHGLLVAFYWIVTSLLTNNEMNLYFTILLFVHAIIILFTSLRDYKVLKGAYIALFIVALLKLFVVDLDGFALVEKVIVFIVIGAILLGSSFLFLKFKKEDK